MMYDVPEQAIQAFERIHSLRVTVHDLAGSLWPHLAPDRFAHKNPLCDAAKMHDGGARCFDLEVTKLQPELPQFPSGRYHICHAGLVEWIVPVYEGTTLTRVLFAGARIPGATFLNVIRMGRWMGTEPPWRTGTELPSTVQSFEADDILEHLRQLAARITLWSREIEVERERHQSSRIAVVNTGQGTDRSVVIRRFIAMTRTEHVSLKDLATHLSLSESRASHLVKQTCGATFRELLIEARITTAQGLLRTSAMSILDVANYSGFRDIAHFHRTFRRATGMSPGQFRRQRSS